MGCSRGKPLCLPCISPRGTLPCAACRSPRRRGRGGPTRGSRRGPGRLHWPQEWRPLPAGSVQTRPGDGGRGFSAWPRADVSCSPGQAGLLRAPSSVQSLNQHALRGALRALRQPGAQGLVGEEGRGNGPLCSGLTSEHRSVKGPSSHCFTHVLSSREAAA